MSYEVTRSVHIFTKRTYKYVHKYAYILRIHIYSATVTVTVAINWLPKEALKKL